MLTWKVNLVSEKQYNCRLKQVEAGKRRKKEKAEEECVVDGWRIVDLKVMADHFQCTFCSNDLSLRYIKSELQCGSASVFHILCHHCLLVNKVPSGAQYTLSRLWRFGIICVQIIARILHSATLPCSAAWPTASVEIIAESNFILQISR